MRLLLAINRVSVRLASHGREPEISTTTAPLCSPHNCRWQPYSSSNDFENNAVIILLVLFCALICALALNAAVRCFLRRRRNQQTVGAGLPISAEERKPEVGLAAVLPTVAPTVVYKAGMEADLTECPICLSEFVEGEEVQILDGCKHGFHGRCIQKWLSSRSSCPTCRSNCFLFTASSTSSSQQSHHRNPA